MLSLEFPNESHRESATAMQYFSQFHNSIWEEFSLSSMENYQATEEDRASFTQVLKDTRVKAYITDDAMRQWGHSDEESLADDILTHSAERWKEGEELRFLLRDSQNSAIGMIGVTLSRGDEWELWYYKTSTAGPCMLEGLHKALLFIQEKWVKKLIAKFEPDNTRSIDILKKLGFSDDWAGQMCLHILQNSTKQEKGESLQAGNQGAQVSKIAWEIIAH